MTRILMLSIAVVLLGTRVQAQTTAHDFVILAEEALANQEDQAAAKYALKGLEAAREVGHPKTRKELIKTFRKLLRKADSLRAHAESAERLAAREAKRLAKKYKRIGWYRTAIALLTAVQRFSDDIEDRDLEPLERLLAKQRPEAKAAPKLGKDHTKRFFATREASAGADGWQMADAVITGPKPTATPALAIGKRELSVPYRFSVETTVAESAGSAGVVFGYKGPSDYWTLTVRHTTPDTEYVLAHATSDGSRSVLTMIRRRDKKQPVGWVPLEVAVTRGSIRLKVGDIEARKLAVPLSDLSGKTGLFSRDEGANGKSATFRNLR